MIIIALDLLLCKKNTMAEGSALPQQVFHIRIHGTAVDESTYVQEQIIGDQIDIRGKKIGKATAKHPGQGSTRIALDIPSSARRVSVSRLLEQGSSGIGKKWRIMEEVEEISFERRSEKLLEISSLSTPSGDQSEDESKHVHRQFFLFCFSILCSISSYSGLMDLQSSINVSDALGNKSLMLMSVSMIICCLVLTPILVQRFGAKRTLIFSQLCYVVYVLANFYPAYFTLLPGGVFFGVGEALLYTPALMYCTFYGRRSARMKGGVAKDKINRFVGYFWGIYQMNEIIGNLISTVVLGVGKLLAINQTESELRGNSPTHFSTSNPHLYFDGDSTSINNSTVDSYNPGGSTAQPDERTRRDFSMCGADDCYEQEDIEKIMDNYVPLSSSSFYVMIGIYTVLAVVAVPIMCMIPPLPKKIVQKKIDKETRRSHICTSCTLVVKNLKKIGRQLVHPQQLLLTPLTLYHGLYVSFISSEINRAYVSCTVGVERVGVGMLAGGVMNVIVSFAFGYVSGRSVCRKLFLFGAISLDLLLYLFCLLWRPTEDDAFFAYVICILFGCTDGVWSPFIDGKYAKYFHDNEEVAYSILNVWTFGGHAMIYAWTAALCVREKIYIQVFMLLLGVILFSGAECLEKKKSDAIAASPH